MQGLFVIISSPSGGGKDSVISSLISKIPSSTKLVTTTSRLPRPDDKPGVTYNFISKDDFLKKINEGDFLEYNFYAGNYYGSEKKILENTLSKFQVVFSQIEVNGKHNLDKLGIKNLSIFLTPESFEILKNRIEQRGGISKTHIEERLKIAQEEIEKSKNYDYKIVNYEGKLEETITKIQKIVETELEKSRSLDKITAFR